MKSPNFSLLSKIIHIEYFCFKQCDEVIIRFQTFHQNCLHFLRLILFNNKMNFFIEIYYMFGKIVNFYV